MEACAKAVKELYDGLDLETALYYPDAYLDGHPAYLAGRGTDTRPNVAGVYRGTIGDRSVMLAAHTDTMPVGDISGWTVPPLGGVIKDGRIYGRGSGDNKFGLVSGYFALKAIKECGIRLKQNVVLSGYCDEEYGGGNGSIASCVKYPCDVYISLDSGNSEIWVSSMGGQALSAEITAKEPQDSTALVIDGLNLLRRHVEAFGERRREELGRNAYYAGTDMHRSCLRLLDFQCGNSGADLSSGKLNFVFYTDQTREKVRGELTEIEQTAKRQLGGMGIVFNGFAPVSRYFDYECADEQDPAVRLMVDCASQIEGKPVKLEGACLSDYFLYLQYGSKSSFGYGILRDFKLYGGAHQPDEFIECHDFVNNVKAIGLFLLRWCGYEIQKAEEE